MSVRGTGSAPLSGEAWASGTPARSFYPTPVKWGPTIAPCRVIMAPAVTMGMVGSGLEQVPHRRSLMFKSLLKAVFSPYQERVKLMRPTQDFRAGSLLSVICF